MELYHTIYHLLFDFVDSCISTAGCRPPLPGLPIPGHSCRSLLRGVASFSPPRTYDTSPRHSPPLRRLPSSTTCHSFTRRGPQHCLDFEKQGDIPADPLQVRYFSGVKCTGYRQRWKSVDESYKTYQVSSTMKNCWRELQNTPAIVNDEKKSTRATTVVAAVAVAVNSLAAVGVAHACYGWYAR